MRERARQPAFSDPARSGDEHIEAFVLYLLKALHLCSSHFYLQLVAVEEAFKNLKGDLAIRPIERRIEAHIFILYLPKALHPCNPGFIAFLAYCLHVTLNRRLHPLAPGLTPRSVIDKSTAVQMLDVHIPTTDGRELVLTRYTQPEPD